MKLMVISFFSMMAFLAFGQNNLKSKFEMERYYWSTALMKVNKDGELGRHSALVLGHRVTKEGVTSDEQIYVKSNRVATKDKPHEVYRYDINFEQKSFSMVVNGETVKGIGALKCGEDGRCDYAFDADDGSFAGRGKYNFAPPEGVAFSERLISTYKDEGKLVVEEYDAIYADITEEVYRHLVKQLVVTGK